VNFDGQRRKLRAILKQLLQRMQFFLQDFSHVLYYPAGGDLIMIKRSVIIAVLLVLAELGIGTTQTAGSGDAVEVTSSGMINWTAGEIYATGIGAPPAQPINAAQARAMAERAAYVVALRNLLEAVKGVRVDSESTVENFMVTNDVIRTRVDGIVKGARIVKTQYMSDGSVEVQVAMPLRGDLLDALVPENFGKPGPQPLKPAPAPQKPSEIKPTPQPSKPEPTKPIVPPPVPEQKPEPVKPSLPPTGQAPEKKPEPSKQPEPSKPAQETPTIAFKGGIATGLVIDGRGLGLRPALLPKILDMQGQEIYVGQVVTRTNAIEQGVAGYAKDVNAAANNFRVTDNPAVLKGLSASGSNKTDIVVGQADARMLQQLSSKGDFLQYCRVIIVY